MSRWEDGSYSTFTFAIVVVRRLKQDDTSSPAVVCIQFTLVDAAGDPPAPRFPSDVGRLESEEEEEEEDEQERIEHTMADTFRSWSSPSPWMTTKSPLSPPGSKSWFPARRGLRYVSMQSLQAPSIPCINPSSMPAACSRGIVPTATISSQKISNAPGKTSVPCSLVLFSIQPLQGSALPSEAPPLSLSPGIGG